MPTSEEKKAFSVRLKFALQRNPHKIVGATELANQFNLDTTASIRCRRRRRTNG